VENPTTALYKALFESEWATWVVKHYLTRTAPRLHLVGVK
jgi:hypothetical protein